VLSAWMMRHYQWSLLKTLEFLRSRRANFKMRTSFLRQLCGYEERLVTQGLGAKTTKWNEVLDQKNFFENEELMMRNTYLNAQKGPCADFSVKGKQPNSTKLKWIDHQTLKTPLASVVEGKPINAKQKKEHDLMSKRSEESSRISKELDTDYSSTSTRLSQEKPAAQKVNKKQLRITIEPIENVLNKYVKSHKPKVIPTRKTKPAPKYERFVKPNERKPKDHNSVKPKSLEEDNTSLERIKQVYKELEQLKSHKRKSTPVPRIINHNNVNNYIIQNPEHVQVIEYNKPNITTKRPSSTIINKSTSKHTHNDKANTSSRLTSSVCNKMETKSDHQTSINRGKVRKTFNSFMNPSRGYAFNPIESDYGYNAYKNSIRSTNIIDPNRFPKTNYLYKNLMRRSGINRGSVSSNIRPSFNNVRRNLSPQIAFKH